MTQSYMLRRMQVSDVKQVIAIHLAAFQGFFLTFLGPSFLRELYTAILADPTGFGFVCVHDRMVQGFVLGTARSPSLYRRLLKQRWCRLGLACIKPALKNPKIIPRLLHAFSKPQESPTVSDCGTLMSIAVLPDMQGLGIGQSLVQAFLHEAASRDLRYVDLTTDYMDNDSVNRFYTKLGFRCARTYITPEGRKMNEYVIDFSSYPAPGSQPPDSQSWQVKSTSRRCLPEKW